MWIIKEMYLISIQSWTHLYIKWINVNSDSWHSWHFYGVINCYKFVSVTSRTKQKQ